MTESEIEALVHHALLDAEDRVLHPERFNARGERVYGRSSAARPPVREEDRLQTALLMVKAIAVYKADLLRRLKADTAAHEAYKRKEKANEDVPAT